MIYHNIMLLVICISFFPVFEAWWIAIIDFSEFRKWSNSVGNVHFVLRLSTGEVMGCGAGGGAAGKQPKRTSLLQLHDVQQGDRLQCYKEPWNKSTVM